MNRLKNNYLKNVAWLNSLNQNKIVPGLDRINDLMLKLENPQKKVEVIVVGGTNAKGSTCFNLNYNITDAGLKIGCFTSPHLHSVRERIRIGNEIISKEEFSKLLSIIETIVVREKIGITYFEALTAAAYYYFWENKVDYAVMEIGLGGEWDAVNIAEPLIAILTTLGIDHIDYLGDNKKDIAITKAKIVREKCDVITGWPKKYHQYIPKCKSITYSNNLKEWLKITMELLGLKNRIKLRQIPGRMEINKNFTLDTAHNPQAIEYLFKMNNNYELVILGIMKDKEIEKIIEKIPESMEILACNLNTERSITSEELKIICQKKGRNCKAFQSISDALSYSKQKKTIALGSFYTASEAREYLEMDGHSEL